MTEVVGGVLAAALDRLLTRTVARHRGARHGLLAVADVSGSWIWQGAHGVADPDGTPICTDTRYPVASVTKLYTMVVLMRLVEQGAITLADRIVDLLPADITDGLHVLDGVDDTPAITVEHLLSHTSGLPDYYEEAPPGGRSPQERLLAGEDAPVPFDEVLRLVREELTPHFAPQPVDASKRRATYADTNFQLLGAVVEAVAGKPLRTVFDETLFRPLRLDDTSSYPQRPRSGAPVEPQAAVWSGKVILKPEGALTHQVADGGIISTLTDQVRFLRAVVGGDVFEDPGTWQRLHERVNRVFFPVDYGLGVMRYAPPRWMSPLFAIPPIVGHSGSTASWLFHCPQLRIITAGTFDVAHPPMPFRFLPRVLRAVERSDLGA
ncbi:MAG: serine hydrolase domain-containing protein [Dermatophilaceae bacterium]